MKTKLALIVAFATMWAALAASFDGVGIILSKSVEGGPIFVTGTIPDSPAEKAVIKKGSWLVSVNGTNTAAIKNLSDRLDMIRGVLNTQVTLGIVEPENWQTNTVVLERRPISLK